MKPIEDEVKELKQDSLAKEDDTPYFFIDTREIRAPYCERTDWSIDYGNGHE